MTTQSNIVWCTTSTCYQVISSQILKYPKRCQSMFLQYEHFRKHMLTKEISKSNTFILHNRAQLCKTRNQDRINFEASQITNH